MSEHAQNTNKLVREIDFSQGKVRELSGKFALLKLWTL